MDGEQFDKLTKHGALLRSMLRRDALKGVVAGALAAIGLGAGHGIEVEAGHCAKKCRKKKTNKAKQRCRRKCRQQEQDTCPNGTVASCASGGCCPNNQPNCCLQGGQPSNGAETCFVPESVCCAQAEGGGACPDTDPVCCAFTEPGTGGRLSCCPDGNECPVFNPEIDDLECPEGFDLVGECCEPVGDGVASAGRRGGTSRLKGVRAR